MSRNTVTDAQDGWWYGVVAPKLQTSFSPADIRTLVNEAFAAGARWNMRKTSQLAPHIAQFCEMIVLLGLFDAEETTHTVTDVCSPENRCALCRRASGPAPGDQSEPPY